MTASKITEADVVQFPMVRHAAEIGWTPLSPSDALAMRDGEAGLLFRGVLEEALHRFNPWLTNDAVRSVVENIQALPPTIEGNRQMLAWLRGERQWYDEAEERHRQVRLVDFDDTSANSLHVTWGVATQASGPQGQPRRRNVRGQRRAGRHRRAQEPDR